MTELLKYSSKIFLNSYGNSQHIKLAWFKVLVWVQETYFFQLVRVKATSSGIKFYGTEIVEAGSVIEIYRYITLSFVNGIFCLPLSRVQKAIGLQKGLDYFCKAYENFNSNGPTAKYHPQFSLISCDLFQFVIEEEVYKRLLYKTWKLIIKLCKLLIFWLSCIADIKMPLI